MRVLCCDHCGVGINKSNKVLVYNFQVRKKDDSTNKPKRDDFDLCDSCRIKLLKWLIEN